MTTATALVDTRALLGLPDPAVVLRTACRTAAGRAHDPGLRAELTRIADTLGRPLQLAVAGAVGAGKSTLINAILGRPVAPADAGECTRVVTWYSYGPDDGLVVVERRHGAPVLRRLVDGRMPEDLGCPVAEVLRVRVLLDDPRLRVLTVIDTPGIDTVRAATEEATRRLLFGDDAAGHAQALVYVLRHLQRFDADVLAEFRALSGAAGMTAVDTAAVLSHVDRVPGGDPWPDAHRVAGRARAALRGVALDVAPVSGLLAETARCRLLGPAELTGLRALAALDDDLLDDLLLDLDDFTGHGAADLAADLGDGPAAALDAALPAPVRAALTGRLHRYGIRVAVDLLRSRPDAGPDALHAALLAASGHDDGLGPAVDRFRRHAHRLTAHAAVARIRRLAARPARHPADRAAVAGLHRVVDADRRIATELRALALPAAGAAVARGELLLDGPMTDELMRMVREDDVAAQLGLPPTAGAGEVVARARAAAARWRAVADAAGRTVGGRRARDVLAVLESIADSLGGPAAPGPAPAPGGSPLDRGRLLALAAHPSVPQDDRDALTRLARSRTAHRAVGLRGATPDERRAAAAGLATRLRRLAAAPLPGPERATLHAVCDLYDRIAGPRPRETP
ncbi:hypothetical protein DMP17_28020 [Pseudonocardia sp. TMWB2A]|uniref:dynamin family protein n=1 Tax=unclassified Pseudonocardia TaxID=2619320 RepID=UPI001CF6A62A|nr:dynamin family protein [Pseudonocardia sp. ICBG162]